MSAKLEPMPEQRRVDNVLPDVEAEALADVLTLGAGADRFQPEPAAGGHLQRARWRSEASRTRSGALHHDDGQRAISVVLATLSATPHARLSVEGIADLTGLTVEEVEEVEERLEALDLTHRLDAHTVALGDGAANALLAAVYAWEAAR